ncbi:MAG TPA: hypothetical protein DCS24_05285 [Erythrobacter sp.]|nr:hypothetical protein [Erythrobacter sp.]
MDPASILLTVGKPPLNPDLLAGLLRWRDWSDHERRVSMLDAGVFRARRDTLQSFILPTLILLWGFGVVAVTAIV